MEVMDNYQPVKFLIVDDDAVSVLSIKRTIKKLGLINPTTVAKDGVEALEILRGEAGHNTLLPPYVVTLDLNMPRMGGIEFLQAVRADPKLCKVVVFVLTTSDAPADVNAAYENNVAGFIVKENASDSFQNALDMIGTYSKLVVLPTE